MGKKSVGLITKAVLIPLLLILLVVVFSCKKKENDIIPPIEDDPIEISLNTNVTFQTIHNFGASDACQLSLWENIGLKSNASK